MKNSLATAFAAVAMTVSIAASAQEAKERPNLMGLSPHVQDLLIEADKHGKDPGLQTMLQLARESQLVALEADPLDIVRLKHAMEVEKIMTGLMLEKQQGAMLDAYLKMTPAERKTFANSSRKFQEAVEAMKAKQAEAAKK